MSLISSLQPFLPRKVKLKSPRLFTLLCIVLISHGCFSSYQYTHQGNEKIESGDFEGAVEAYTRAIEMDPNNARAYYNRAIAFEMLGDPFNALEDYTKAIEIRPDYAEAYNNRGCLRMNERDYEEAIEDFSRAIQIKPGYALAFDNRGRSWVELREYRQAIKDFKKVIELDPNRMEKALERIKFCESKIKDRKGSQYSSKM